MQDRLEPDASSYDGLIVSERGPWYIRLWDSLSRLDGCKYGVGAILIVLAIPGNSPVVKVSAVVVIGVLAIGDELRKLNFYAENRNQIQTKEIES